MVNGELKQLNIPPSCNVVLALSAIETTRLALVSFPTVRWVALYGASAQRFHGAHSPQCLRCAVVASSVPRVRFVRGGTVQGRFHIQVTAAANQQSDSDELLFRMIPDMDVLGPTWITRTATDRDHAAWNRGSPTRRPRSRTAKAGSISVPMRATSSRFRAPGCRSRHPPSTSNSGRRWTLKPFSRQAAGRGSIREHRVFVRTAPGGRNLRRSIARSPRHRGLGTTFHEAGTLWMGTNPAQSA